MGWKTSSNGGKSSSLKEKEIVTGTNCLETSLYNVLIIGEEFIERLFHAVNIDSTDLANLIFPCLTRCRESLYKRDQSRDPFVCLNPWSWTIKTKLFLWNTYFNMSFTLFINNLLTDDHSSRKTTLHMISVYFEI